MNQFDAVINALPAPTWNRLHMNDVKLQIPEGAAGELIIEMPDDVDLTAAPEAAVRFDQVPTGMGTDIDRALQSTDKRVSVLTAAGKNSVVKMQFPFTGSQPRYFVGIEAKKDAQLTVLMDFTAGEKAAAEDAAALIQTKILAEEGACVRLVQVLRAGESWRVLADNGNSCGDNAKVDIVQVVLSGKENYIGSRSELQGTGSSMESHIGFRVSGHDRLDVNYIANHYGKHTECNIDALGVLRDEAFKLFRGTIDFKKGSKASLGNEKEDVLLMDEGVVNQTIPLILCAEEDVEGNHGATIGRLDDEAMFYLQSRGMTQDEVLQLLERGRLASVIRRIPDEALKTELLESIGE